MTETLQQKIDDFWYTSNSIEDYRDNIDKALQEFREQIQAMKAVYQFRLDGGDTNAYFAIVPLNDTLALIGETKPNRV